jgi:CheY-like chemotaxis protein
MAEASPLRALTRETKALIIVSEFEAKQMPRAQLRAVLDEIACDEEEREVILGLVESDLRATGYDAKEIAALLDDLLEEEAGEDDVTATRLFRRPFALGLGGQNVVAGSSAESAGETETLPRPAPNAKKKSSSRGKSVEPARHGTGGVHQPRVLLVDDDRHIRMMLRVRLQKLGCSIVEANDGEAAWEIIRNGEADLAVLDMKMPRLHGTKLLARMLEQGITPPVVVCSAHDQHRQEAPVTHYPKLRYLVKPVPAEAMEKAVKDMLALLKK